MDADSSFKVVELCVCVGAQADEEGQTWASVSDLTRMGGEIDAI